MASQKKIKLHDFKYFGFNIKILSKERKGTEMYEKLIKDLFSKDIVSIVGGEKAITLRTQFSIKVPSKSGEASVFYGKMTRYTTLDGKNWYDQVKKEYVNYEVPLNIFPNGFDTDYIFIPAAHRFFVRVNSKVSISSVERYLLLAIPEVINSNESYLVNIIQSQDVIEKILNAGELSMLKVEISYTNDDIGDAAQQLMDKLLKNGNIGRFDATFRPDQTGTLETDSDFIRGVLELAKENGAAQATIKGDNGRRVKVNTSNYPEKIIIRSEDDNLSMIDLVSKTMRNYRNE
jgi:hypothetical protein